MSREWSRRQLLAVSGTAAVAGCFGTDDPAESNDETNDSSEATTDETDGENAATGESDGDETTGEESADEADTDEESTVHEEYETTDVTAATPNGDELESVTAAIADTTELRYLGLSDTEELPADRGMLFVYESVDDRAFVMREMDFGIDIVYADADGAITEIHHAPEPGPNEDGEDQVYPGRGQYVLEVNYEWTSDHDVSEGDVLEFDLE